MILHAGEPDDPLEGTPVHEESSTRRYAYGALSYVWVPPIVSFPIAIDGSALLLTKSLKDALRRLRYSDRSQTVWADAI